MPARVRPRSSGRGDRRGARAGETEIDDNGRPESAARAGPRFLYRRRRRRHERLTRSGPFRRATLRYTSTPSVGALSTAAGVALHVVRWSCGGSLLGGGQCQQDPTEIGWRMRGLALTSRQADQFPHVHV